MATIKVDPVEDCINDIGCVSLKKDFSGFNMMTRWQRRIYNFFTPRGHHIIKALIATMVADDPAVLTRVRLQRVILRTEKYISELPFFFFLTIKLSLYVMEYALPPLSWKLRPFSYLSPQQRLAFLAEWQGSRFYPKRMMFRMVSAVCLAHLYSEKRLLVSLGFESALQNRIAHQVSGDHPRNSHL